MNPIQEINEILDRELQNYAREASAILKREMEKKGLVVSGELIDSFTMNLVQGGGNLVSEMSVSFAAHGRHMDMKKLRYVKMPPVDLIQEWVEKIGVHNFKFVPNFKSKKPEVETVAANRIAWGIALSKKRSDTVKGKKWYNKLMWSEINKLEMKISQHFTLAMRTHLRDLMEQK